VVLAESAADFTIELSGIQNVPFRGDSCCKPSHRITVHWAGRRAFSLTFSITQHFPFHVAGAA